MSEQNVKICMDNLQYNSSQASPLHKYVICMEKKRTFCNIIHNQRKVPELRYQTSAQQILKNLNCNIQTYQMESNYIIWIIKQRQSNKINVNGKIGFVFDSFSPVRVLSVLGIVAGFFLNLTSEDDNYFWYIHFFIRDNELNSVLFISNLKNYSRHVYVPNQWWYRNRLIYQQLVCLYVLHSV